MKSESEFVERYLASLASLSVVYVVVPDYGISEFIWGDPTNHCCCCIQQQSEEVDEKSTPNRFKRILLERV